MAATYKGAITFGLVHIPISLYTATQDNEIHFNQLCKEDLSRVRYKKVCASCGKEITSKDIVKGFEYDKDKYVIVTDEDFEKIKTEKDKSIKILHFTDVSSIRPIYYDKTYHAIGEAGGEKAFELLRRAMLEENKVGIGKTVMGNKETLLCIIPTEEGILVETMFFADEIKEIPKSMPDTNISDEEVKMAKELIKTIDKPFEPEVYKDEYQSRLRELIQAKIAGKEISVPKPKKQDNVINLMDALKASIEQNKSPKKAAKPRKTANR
ncbi:MAG: Ku protein [Eubacteriales bacterium]